MQKSILIYACHPKRKKKMMKETNDSVRIDPCLSEIFNGHPCDPQPSLFLGEIVCRLIRPKVLCNHLNAAPTPSLPPLVLFCLLIVRSSSFWQFLALLPLSLFFPDGEVEGGKNFGRKCVSLFFFFLKDTVSRPNKRVLHTLSLLRPAKQAFLRPKTSSTLDLIVSDGFFFPPTVSRKKHRPGTKFSYVGPL